MLCEGRGTGRGRICDEDGRLPSGTAEEPGFIAKRYFAPECKCSKMVPVTLISLVKHVKAVFSDAHHLENSQAVKRSYDPRWMRLVLWIR